MGGGGAQEPRQLEGEQFPGGRGFWPARPVLLTPGEKPGPADVQSVVGSLVTARDPFLMKSLRHWGPGLQPILGG